ncbi:MAG: APC family permease [Novosphingobium sp.]
MQEPIKPPRVIGLAGAVLINLNAVVGAGIFALPALLYAGAGTLAPLIVLAYAVVVIPLLLIVAKLSTLFEESGGAQLYAERTYGSFAGFQVGFALLGGNSASRAANFHVLVSYLAALFPVFDVPAVRLATILALIGLLTTFSAIGTRRSMDALGIGTALKLGPILLICIAGLIANGVPTAVSLPQFSNIESIALLLAYAYSGAAASTVAAGEVKDARRTVYRSILVNLVVIALFYAFVQWAYIAINPQQVNAARPLASAGEAVLGQWGVIAISVAAIFSVGTNQMSYFVAMPRVIFGMSERGLLPTPFARISRRFLTPVNAIVAYGTIVALLAISGTFKTLATLMVAMEALILVTVIMTLPILWYQGKVAASSLGMIGWGALVAAALAFEFWLLGQVPAGAALSTVSVLLVGCVLYALMRRTRPRGVLG